MDETSLQKKKITILIEKDQDDYLIASAPELPGCYTQGKTMDELMKRMQEAVELYLETADTEVKERVNKDFVGIQFLK